MRYPYSDVKFTWEEWHQYQNDLALADPILEDIARQSGMTLIVSAKYPGRTLKQRRLMRLFLVNLTLDWEARDVRQPSYILSIGYYKVALPFCVRLAGSRTMDKFSRAELHDSTRIKLACQKAVNEMISTFDM